MSYRKSMPTSADVSATDWDTLAALAVNDSDRFRRLLTSISTGHLEVRDIPIDVKTVRPLSIEEVAIMFAIDLEKYEPVNVRSNVWSVGMKIKGEDGKETVVKEPLFQMKITFRPKKQTDMENLRQWMTEVSAGIAPFVREDSGATQRSYAAEICLFDHHMGKTGIDEEWALQRASEVWWDALNNMLDQMPLSQIDKFLLPCGNDFMHIDNSKGLTYNGTPVGDGGSWFKMVLAGKELLCETIAHLAKLGDVVVPFIAGNHDSDTTFSLGEMVAERFRDWPNVKVINSEKSRWYWRYGTNLIGFTHGDQMNMARLATMMPIEMPMDFAQTTHRAWHIGHWHFRKRISGIEAVEEHSGIDVEIIPSLSPKDRWHDTKGFVGAKRRATAFLYHAEDGMCQQFWYHKK